MEKPLKIVFIIDSLTSNLGGTENQLIKLINGLDKKGFQIQLICFRDELWLQENGRFLKCNIKVIEMRRFSYFSTYYNFLKLILFLRKSKPDIVHTFFPVGNIVGVLAAKIAGVQQVISSRRDYGEWMRGPYLICTRFANRFVKKILVNSTPVKEITVKMEKVSDQKIDVILNGLDTEKFRKIERDVVLRKKLNITDQDKVVGIVANFRPMKHHYTIIKAAHEILKSRTDIKFILVGEGELEEKSKTLGRSLNISSHLIFTGPQAEIIPYLSIMDVGVNCSEGEGLSNAIMEYMITGIPCVVSNAGGNPDLIEHEVNGYMFPLDDFRTLASLVLKLLDDVETQNKFKDNARKKIENEMRLDVILARYEDFYRKMLNA